MSPTTGSTSVTLVSSATLARNGEPQTVQSTSVKSLTASQREHGQPMGVLPAGGGVGPACGGTRAPGGGATGRTTSSNGAVSGSGAGAPYAAVGAGTSGTAGGGGGGRKSA